MKKAITKITVIALPSRMKKNENSKLKLEGKQIRNVMGL